LVNSLGADDLDDDFRILHVQGPRLKFGRCHGLRAAFLGTLYSAEYGLFIDEVRDEANRGDTKRAPSAELVGGHAVKLEDVLNALCSKKYNNGLCFAVQRDAFHMVGVKHFR